MGNRDPLSRAHLYSTDEGKNEVMIFSMIFVESESDTG